MRIQNIRLIDNPSDKQLAMDLRVEVFVDEQKVPFEDERDEFEETCRHFIAKNELDQTIGTARWRYTEKGIKLERFAIKKDFRGQGWGSRLVETVLKDIAAQPNAEGLKIYLHAQVDAVPLYKKFGFKEVGEIFEECGILHRTMEKY